MKEISPLPGALQAMGTGLSRHDNARLTLA
jgi:hypothetical protein